MTGPCHPYKCVKRFSMAMATKYTDQHWSVTYSEPQGVYQVTHQIFVGDNNYRAAMKADGFEFNCGRVDGDRVCEFWIGKDSP